MVFSGFEQIRLDLTRGVGRRRRRKVWSDAFKWHARQQFRRVGFTSSEIDLLIAERIEPSSRVGQNFIAARRYVVRGYMREGLNFREAVQAAVNDSQEEAMLKKTREFMERYALTQSQAEEMAKGYVWATLYALTKEERKTSGPVVRRRIVG